MVVNLQSVDELIQKLEYKSYELEMTKNEANEEIRKSNEHIKKLVHLLQTACKERDDAKSQLSKLQQIMAFNKQNNNNNLVDHLIPFSPDSPLMTSNFAAKTNSAVTDSSSFSLETHTNNNKNKNNNIVSSPVASSPESSNIIFSTSTSTTTTTSPVVMNSTTKVVDRESMIIASLAKGKTLPQKGKLLQSVLGAGPLLSTLMVAGSLPEWRNPPAVLTHQIPPVNLKSQPSNVLPQIIVPNVDSNHFNKGIGNSAMYNGAFGICPTPILDFGNGSSPGSCFTGGRMMLSPGVNFNCQIPKRQRII